MKYVWKNMSWKTGLCAVGFALLFLLMAKILGRDPWTTFRMLWGGEPLGSVAQRGGFLLTCLLCQYPNYDSVVYFLRNNGPLILRYGRKKRAFLTMWKVLLVGQLGFVLLGFGGSLLAYSAIGPEVAPLTASQGLAMLGKTYLFALLLTQGQVLLLILLRAERAFLALVAVAYGLSLLSWRAPRVWLFPVETTPAVHPSFLLCWVLVSLVLTLATVRIVETKESL